jgi:hypothetical protein
MFMCEGILAILVDIGPIRIMRCSRFTRWRGRERVCVMIFREENMGMDDWVFH